MTGYPYRMLFGWIAALALAWLILSSPWSKSWNLLLAGFVLALAGTAILVVTRRVHARQEASRAVLTAIDAQLDALPGDVRRNSPLVLTVADADGVLALAFGDALVKVTDAAIWVRVDEASRLAFVADALKRWRDGQGPDAVAWLVAADQTKESHTLNAALRRWRAAIDEASRAVGYPLPVCLAVYTEEINGPREDCPWFGMTGDVPLDEALRTQLGDRLAQFPLVAVPSDRAARFHRAARLDALARWATEALLPALRSDAQGGGRPVRLAAFGVTAVAGGPASDSLVAQFVARTTGLFPASHDDRSATYPLPDPLIRDIPMQPIQRVLPSVLAHGFFWLALAFCAAAAASAWQNRLLTARIMNDMASYRVIDTAQDVALVDALQRLKHDRDELEHYQRSGVPPRLGMGFYRGASLLGPLNALIASYQPPAPPPSTIELDSLSLFRSGSAKLGPGSNRALIGALEMVKENPDRRVLVAGHADSTGNPVLNLKLSEARAASVRDWLADAAGLPLTHFAVQGYGDTRAKASNDTEAGRAANRRVEITLVPDCRDVSRAGQASSGHPACSYQSKEK